ncbi:MAG TPA: hypothetical protein VK497_04250 [Candidatus Saccharimonadales bacterium]|nr:hypothetical protein [Candidatus Saccharimonadales bacterium]
MDIAEAYRDRTRHEPQGVDPCELMPGRRSADGIVEHRKYPASVDRVHSASGSLRMGVVRTYPCHADRMALRWVRPWPIVRTSRSLQTFVRVGVRRDAARRSFFFGRLKD